MREIVFATAILLFMSAAYAGQINGTLRKDGKPIEQGISVTIKCPKDSYEGKTRARGYFSVYVREKGKCQFSVPEYPGTGALVYSYKNPVSYNFNLVKDSGNYKLKKR